MIAAVVPVKSLESPKSRLRPRLGEAGVRALTLAMLGDLLETLAAVPGIDRVAVVTPDATVGQVTRDAGALALVRDDPGLNAAIEAASKEVAPGPEDAVLTVLGDVPGATPADVARLLAEAPAHGIALAPSSDGGTAALLRRPPDVVPARFGADSAKAHREAAERAGVACVELPLASLSLDLDDAGDLERFLASSAGGPRTRELLAALEAE